MLPTMCEGPSTKQLIEFYREEFFKLLQLILVSVFYLD